MKQLTICLLFSVNAFSQIAAVKQDEGVSKKQLKEVIIVYTMHYDIGYTDLAENVKYKYRTIMMDEALHSVKATAHLPAEKQFVWCTPGWPMKYVMENATAERKAGLADAIKGQRFALQALAFDVETEVSDMENLVRSMNYSSALSRQFNLKLPRDAKLTDVPEHSWLLPTVLKNAGVEVLHIGCNPGSVSPDVPRLFWWEGPDSSRLLTFYWDQYYGSGLLPPEDWNHQTWLAMISTHENTGPPRPEEVVKLLQEAKEKLPGVKVRIGRLSDFYDAIVKEKAQLPVVRGDMPDTWIHGYMSMPRQMKTNKQYQRSVYASEALHTQEKLWGAKTDVVSADVDNATEKMLLFEEHTFGLALSHGAGREFTYRDDFIINHARGNYNRAEISWREKAAHIDNVERTGAMLEKNMLKTLAASVAVEGKRIVVYNAMPWMRSDNVKLFLSIYRKDKNITALKDTRTGALIPVYNKGNLLQFHAQDIPAMGYATYIPAWDGSIIEKNNGLLLNEAAHSIENKFLKIKFDAMKGTIASCIDKKTGKELVDASSQYGMGEYFHEYFGAEELKRYNDAYVKPGAHDWADDEMGRPMKNFTLQYKQSRADKGRWVFHKNEEEITATWFSQLALHNTQQYAVTYVISAHTPRIELVWSVQNKQAEPDPEAGWIALPFNAQQPNFHLGRPGGIANPSKDFVPRTNFDYILLNTGMAVSDAKGFGVGINSPDAPAVSIERPGLYRFSKEFHPRKSTVFVNLYNTQWGTNFTEWIDGNWSAKIYIWPVSDYNNESGLITPMEETRQPLSGFYIDEAAGKLPTTKQGVNLSKKGIIVTSFAPLSDTKKYRLRLWEMAGNAGICEIELPDRQFTKATLANLRDEPLVANPPIAIKNNKLTIEVKPNQPVTLLLE